MKKQNALQKSVTGLRNWLRFFCFKRSVQREFEYGIYEDPETHQLFLYKADQDRPEGLELMCMYKSEGLQIRRGQVKAAYIASFISNKYNTRVSVTVMFEVTNKN